MISLEYFLGSLLTVATALFLYKKNNINYVNNNVKISQSRTAELLRPFLVEKPKVKKEKQSDIHNKKINIKVLIMDDRAFWIKNNIVYSAEVDNNEVVRNSTVEVDMIGLDKVELDKMMFIIDKLNERQEDDNRSSGF